MRNARFASILEISFKVAAAAVAVTAAAAVAVNAVAVVAAAAVAVVAAAAVAVSPNDSAMPD